MTNNYPAFSWSTFAITSIQCAHQKKSTSQSSHESASQWNAVVIEMTQDSGPQLNQLEDANASDGSLEEHEGSLGSDTDDWDDQQTIRFELDEDFVLETPMNSRKVIAKVDSNELSLMCSRRHVRKRTAIRRVKESLMKAIDPKVKSTSQFPDGLRREQKRRRDYSTAMRLAKWQGTT